MSTSADTGAGKWLGVAFIVLAVLAVLYLLGITLAPLGLLLLVALVSGGVWGLTRTRSASGVLPMLRFRVRHASTSLDHSCGSGCTTLPQS